VSESDAVAPVPSVLKPSGLIPEAETPPKILVIEESDALAREQMQLLTSGGFLSKHVHKSREAMDLLLRESFDLVLLDLENKDDQDCFETCRQIKANPALTWMPVMFATQRINKEVVSQIFQAGGDEFVGKPLQPDELVVRAKVLVRKGHEERWLVERARKLAEKIAERDDELDDLRRFAQDIVSSLSSALLVLDAEETILFANAPFLEALHAERKSVVGRKLGEFITGDAQAGGRGALTNSIRAAINTGQLTLLARTCV
jgi:DNA-binding response OmpR family regulator